MNKYYAGLDIGGSTVKCLLVDGEGNPVGDIIELKSHVKDGYRRTFGQMTSAMETLAANAGTTVDEIVAVFGLKNRPSADAG